MGARTVVALVATSLLMLGGCGTGQSGDVSRQPSVSSPPSPSVTKVSALERWKTVLGFVAKQRKDPEVVCYLRSGEAAEFYSFGSQGSEWKPYLGSRDEQKFVASNKQCQISVPATHPYTVEGIEGFLNPKGFWFKTGSPGERRGLKRIEIAYPGQNAEDPDIYYADKPGLWALRLALSPLSDSAYLPDTTMIRMPRNDAEAEMFLRCAQPMLKWYGYSG